MLSSLEGSFRHMSNSTTPTARSLRFFSSNINEKATTDKQRIRFHSPIVIERSPTKNEVKMVRKGPETEEYRREWVHRVVAEARGGMAPGPRER